MKSSTYELHNYAELDMDLDSDQMQSEAKGSRKRKANNATGCRRGEKYSLRQKRQKRIPGEPSSMPSSPATEMESAAAATTTTAKATPTAAKAKSSAKTKAPPLSKYRRKTANARERTRMREINMAFEQLRHCVPQSITGEDAASTNEKLTKITTLRLAMKYIGMLSESLQDPSYESDFLVECLRESASRDPHVSLDTDPEAEVEVEPEYESTPVKSKKQSKASKKTPAKRQSKQTKTTKTTAATTAATTSMMTSSTASSSPESCYASSSVGSPAFCAAACSPSSAYASLSSSASTSSSSRSSSSSDGAAPLDADSLLGMQALTELHTLLLESDSESLHCLDPGYQSLLATAGSLLPARGDLPISMHSPLDKPDVELSLRLLDHSTSDSFDFASDQQPSACISPLATLDSFHPYGDLLQGEFPDLFLT